MSELLTPADVKRLASERGLTMVTVCAKAGIAVSTFSRWQAGKTEPTLDVYRRIRDAVQPPEGPASARAEGA